MTLSCSVGKLAVAIVTGDISQNVNFAIKSDIARAFLDTHSVPYGVGAEIKDLPVSEVADRARDFAVAIICVK